MGSWSPEPPARGTRVSSPWVDSPFVLVAQLRAGMVKSCRIFYDRLTTLEQEGIVSLEQFGAQLAHA